MGQEGGAAKVISPDDHLRGGAKRFPLPNGRPMGGYDFGLRFRGRCRSKDLYVVPRNGWV